MEVSFILDDKWDLVPLNGEITLYKPKHINVNVDWSNLAKVKSLKLPYILIHYKNKKIASIEANAGCIRAVPILYFSTNNYCIISNSVEEVIKKTGKKELDELAVSEFLCFGYVTFNKTLISGIKCLQVGEILFTEKDNFIVKDDYIYNTVELENKSQKEFKQELKITSEDVFNDLIKSIKGKTALVPLSGGYDSRFILAMLHMGGVKDVVTYSWGISDNEDIRIGKAVAEKLKYEWHPVSHDYNKWESSFCSTWFLDCLNYLHKYISISGSASLLFIKYLMENNNIEECSNGQVIIPGHTGDFITGGHIPLGIKRSRSMNDIVCSIINKHFQFNTNHIPAEIRLELEKQINHYSNNVNACELWRIFELWEWRERQSKFIANANRYYEYAGFNWSMPFWDLRYINFWDKVPLKFKLNKMLYKDYLEKDIFDSLGINYNQKKSKNWNKTISNIPRNISKNNRLATLFFQYLKKKGLSKYLILPKAPNIYGFDFAFPLLTLKAQNEFSESYEIVNNYNEKLFKDSWNSRNPYTYLSEFILTLAVDNLNNNECKEMRSLNE